jgi:TonB family protein
MHILRNLLAVSILLAAPRAEAELQKVLVTQARGAVVVAPDGQVAELRLDTALDPALATAVERGLRAMRFKPTIVAGVAAPARAGFIVFLAGERDGDQLRTRFDGIRFHAPPPTAGSSAAGISIFQLRSDNAPKYPEQLMRAGISGEVELAFLVGPDGKATDITVVRSGLVGALPRGTVAGKAMKSFEKAALAAGRQWTFEVPAALAIGSAKDRTFLTTLTFSVGLANPRIHGDGEWVELLRGEVRPIPWLGADTAGALADSSTRDGSSARLVGSLELSSPLAGTPLL